MDKEIISLSYNKIDLSMAKYYCCETTFETRCNQFSCGGNNITHP